MPTLKIFAALLHYPDQALQDHGAELTEALMREDRLQGPERDALVDLIERLRTSDLFDAQAVYVDTFDRGRARSLYLFEHLHGESRDRGTAMVELLHIYRQAGLEIAGRELPDYLPLFLEFLSTQPPESALSWLEEIGPVLQRLHARLAERGSPYTAVLAPLVRFAGLDPEDAGLRAQIAAEPRDDTRQALDQVWQEAQVSFGAQEGDGNHGASCPPHIGIPPCHQPRSC